MKVFIYDSMSERESSILILIGGLLAILALWALSILAVRWDTQRRRLSEFERRAWVVLAFVLPLFGFAVYIFLRLVRGYLALPDPEDPSGDAYRTAVKPRVNGRTYTAIDSSGARSHPGVPQPAWGQAPPEGANGKQTHPLGEASSIAGDDPEAVSAPFQPPQPNYALVALEGPHLGQQFILNRYPALIGRGTEVAVPLDADLNISRRHAEIYMQGSELRLRDLKSTHGTLVNDHPVDDHALAPGDRIRLGGTVLILREIQ